MWLETAIDADVGTRQGGLPHGMAEYTVQIDECRFTLVIDGPQIRLHHHDMIVGVRRTCSTARRRSPGSSS